jgi:hypothetical protein
MAKRTSAPIDPYADHWRVTLERPDHRSVQLFAREESAQHYADHANRAGVWIGNMFHTDVIATVVPPDVPRP